MLLKKMLLKKMLLRNTRVCLRLAAATAIGSLVSVPSAIAVDAYFDGSTSNDYNVDANWGPFGFRPEGAGGINERAVIGYDDPAALLSPAVTLAATPPNPGGLVLGVRERNAQGVPVNIPPAPGALTGSLTITSGTLTNVVGSAPGIDGRVQVGVDGRGYLTMTGGVLNALGLVVGGERVTTGNGTSLVDLSGSATVTITGGSGQAGLATFGRRLKVTGPSVNFSATRNIRLEASNAYTAVITSATTHSALKSSANVIYGGALNVQFSGAGATHTLGTSSWPLFDAALNVTGAFNNLSPGGDVPVTGLAAPPPAGAVYRLRTVAGLMNHQILELAYDRVLVLRVNRDTGELSITNPLGASASIDSYSVTSPLGSLLASYKGISGAPAGAPNWQKYGLSPNALAEVINDPANSNTVLNLTSVPLLTLGNGFNKLAVGGSAANFGTDGEDLTFMYSSVDGPIVHGVVEYVGTKYENNLVLRVNPTSGVAFLKNDSMIPVTIDGYSILSSTAALSVGWTGLAGTWEKSTPPTTSALSQTNPTGSTTIAPGAQVALGDIGAFATAADQAGLSMQFILAEGFSGGAAGDFDVDGDVDGADFLVWQRGVGTQFDDADLADWRANYGSIGGGGPPETTFRVGSILFDPTAAAAPAGSPIPEPQTGLLVVVGFALVALAARSGAVSQRSGRSRVACWISQLDLTGAAIMPRVHSHRVAALAGFVAALSLVAPAAAVTQGIPLTNSRMELPGPEGFKRIAFNPDGSPNAGIPGWTFPGPGVETFGHDGMNNTQLIRGDSGTEGGGNPGNEILLSMLDGVTYQTSAFNVVSIPAMQKYRLSFDAHNIFTIDANGAGFPDSQCQLTARLYFLAANGTTRTTIGAPLVLDALPGGFMNFSIEFVGGAAELAPALNRPIGVEFDTTSDQFNPLVAHSWVGIDNVLLQIAGVTAGDLDGDNDVDLVDYRIIRDNLQEPHDFLAEGELTGDGLVNLDDFRAWKELPPVIASGVLSQIGVPEPSAAVLALAAVAALGRRARVRSVPSRRARRRRIAMRRPLRNLLVVAVATGAALTAARSSATLLAYDPILLGSNPAIGEYTVDAVVAGQNPTIGPAAPSFFRDPWFSAAGVATQVVQADTLSFLGSPSLGGAISGFGRTSRFLNVGWDDSTSGTFYIGFQINFGAIASGGNMGYRAFETYPVGVDPGENRNGDIGYNEYFSEFGSVQQNAATAKMQFNIGGQQIIDGGPDTYNLDGTTHLIVLKFVLSGTPGDGLDAASMFLDPTGATEPALPNATRMGTGMGTPGAFDFTLGAIGPASFGSTIPGTTTVFDELRVGTTFAEAVVDFPLPGDTNGDDLVDLVDYNNIVSHMNQMVGSALEGDVAKGDGTQGSDGRVSIADFRIWRDHRTDVPLGSGVPEPTGWMLALAAAGLIGTRCRRWRDASWCG